MDEIDAAQSEEVGLVSLCTELQILEEGKWVDGHIKDGIRLDRATCGVGQDHAHIHDRKGNQIGVINKDGSRSHKTKKMKLTKKDANALRNADYTIPTNNLVEVELHSEMAEILLE